MITTSPTPRNQARRQATDTKLAHGLFAVVKARGVEGVTIDAVSEASGVAKTTIYRRYRNRVHMMEGIAETINARLTDSYEISFTGLKELMHDLVELFEQYGGSRVVGEVLISSNEDIEHLRKALFKDNRTVMSKLLEDGIESGVFRPDLNVHATVNMLIGALIVSGAGDRELNDSWINGIVDTLADGIRTPATTTGSPEAN